MSTVKTQEKVPSETSGFKGIKNLSLMQKTLSPTNHIKSASKQKKQDSRPIKFGKKVVINLKKHK